MGGGGDKTDTDRQAARGNKTDRQAERGDKTDTDRQAEREDKTDRQGGEDRH